MDILTTLIATSAIAILFKKYLYDSDDHTKSENKTIDKTATPEIVPSKKIERATTDFFGVDKAKNSPDDFLKDIDELKKKLERGEKLRVNAAEALYLMRTEKYHNLIIGEDGCVNYKRLTDMLLVDEESIDETLLQNSPLVNQKIKPQKENNSLPHYVKKEEQIADGGYRWVYHDWHVADCSIASICFDKYGRPVQDPDIPSVTKKQKNSQQINAERNEKEDPLLVNISKQLSKVKVMVEEDRVDRLLNSTNSSSSQETFPSELEQLEMEHEIPDFTMPVMKNNSLLEIDMIDFDEGEVQADEEQAESVEDIYQEINYQARYGNFEMFVSFEASKPEFVYAVLDNVFSKKGIASVYVNYKNKELLVEKNYFTKCIIEVLVESDKAQFVKDFEVVFFPGVYVGEKVNFVLDSMRLVKKFMSVGTKSKNLFNLRATCKSKPEIFQQSA